MFRSVFKPRQCYWKFKRYIANILDAFRFFTFYFIRKNRSGWQRFSPTGFCVFLTNLGGFDLRDLFFWGYKGVY
jgi:hypothetical protein